MRQHDKAWTPSSVSIKDGGGPTRVVTDEPDPDFKPNPVGFAPPPPETDEQEPQA